MLNKYQIPRPDNAKDHKKDNGQGGMDEEK